MLENLPANFRIMDRELPSPTELASLIAIRPLPADVVRLYEEVSSVDIEGPEPRYFRFWSPDEVLEIDTAYGVSAAVPRSIPIGSNGGGRLIIVRDGRVFSVGYGALHEDQLRLLANSLKEFLQNPEPLWPWIDE